MKNNDAIILRHALTTIKASYAIVDVELLAQGIQAAMPSLSAYIDQFVMVARDVGLNELEMGAILFKTMKDKYPFISDEVTLFVIHRNTLAP